MNFLLETVTVIIVQNSAMYVLSFTFYWNVLMEAVPRI
jgi:hypothetical protein